MSNEKDRDKELEDLKKRIVNIVGKEEIERIKKIVELSYKMDGKMDEKKYEVRYYIIGDRDYAIKE